jgi:hypothetical protein
MSELHSFVLTSPADAMVRDAIATTCRAEPHARAELFERLLREIEAFMRLHPKELAFRVIAYSGTDGSRIFRSRDGRSIVIDPAGAMWRARSYEDFDTTYTSPESGCRIETLTPRYEQMWPITEASSSPSPDR